VLAERPGAFYAGDCFDIEIKNQNGQVTAPQMHDTILVGGEILPDAGRGWRVNATGGFYGNGNT
jgi:hypothetical protein